MSARQIKYLLVPGIIVKGQDRHRISAPVLARLYGVDPRECFSRQEGQSFTNFDGDLIALMPESSGFYDVSLCRTVASMIYIEIAAQGRNSFKERR